jgi:hypothetical protein
MTFEAFCQTFAIKLRKVASTLQRDKAEAKFGGTFTSSIREVYEACDGGMAKNSLSSLEINSIKAALAYGGVPGFFDAPWACWPLIENNDSNPLCVCCKPPLTGYVVLVSHDGEPRLLFRSLGNFFRAASEIVASGEYLDTSELRGDFIGPERTKTDLSAAKKLIAVAKNLKDERQTDALCFAADLLPDTEADQIEKLLDFDNAGAAEYLAERLKRIPYRKPARKTKTSTKPVKEAFDDFVERCGEILKKTDLETTVLEMYGKKTIRLERGPVWLNMELFYQNRHRADFDDYMLDLVRKAVKGKRRK